MRPVERGDAPLDASGQVLEFAHYQEARDPLISRMGDYCSYCEIVLHSVIAVEHILPKNMHPEHERSWSNFLLACSSCNSVKSKNAIDMPEYLWPHLDNTYLAFDYLADMPPQVSSRLTASLQTIASQTLILTGLDRYPGHPDLTDKDRRWLKRSEAWGNALNSLQKLRNADTPGLRDSIVLTAISRGFWSVWMTVFRDDPDMLRRFIRAFPGTAECFDEFGKPKARLGGQI